MRSQNLSWRRVGRALAIFFSVVALISLLALLTGFTAGCGHRIGMAPPAASRFASFVTSPQFLICGTWSGTKGKTQINYEFHHNGTVSLATQNRGGSMSITRGSYAITGNKLSIYPASLMTMGRTAREDNGPAHTIAIKDDQLNILDMGLVLYKQFNTVVDPFDPDLPGGGPYYYMRPINGQLRGSANGGGVTH